MLKIFDTISKHSLPRITKTEIICGDCAGDELLPVRTNLTTTGACAVCGGRSFVIASLICEALSRHLKNQIKERQIKEYEQNTHSKTTRDFIEIDTNLWH